MKGTLKGWMLLGSKPFQPLFLAMWQFLLATLKLSIVFDLAIILSWIHLIRNNRDMIKHIWSNLCCRIICKSKQLETKEQPGNKEIMQYLKTISQEMLMAKENVLPAL